MPRGTKQSEDEKRIEEALKVLRAGGLSSFWYFATRILKRKFIAHVHGDVCEGMEKAVGEGVGELIVMMPRGHFKSTMIAAYIAWRIVHDRNIRVMVVSASDDNSGKTVSQVQQFLEMELVTTLYGDFKSARKWSADEFIVSGRTDALRDPTCVAKGRKNFKPGPHLELLVFDDFEDKDTTATAELILQGQELDENASPMVDRPGSLRITAGTYWSDMDLHCHKEEKYGLLQSETLPDGRKIKKRVNDQRKGRIHYFYKALYNADGSILFPEEWSPEKIAAKRLDMSPSTFAKQYLMDPVHRETAHFRDEDFVVKPCPFEEGATIVGMDYANTKSVDSDQSGYVVILVSPDFKIHVAEAWGRKLDGKEQQDEIWRIEATWDRPDYALEEDNYVRGWKIGFEEVQRQRRQWPRMNYIGAHNRGSKDDRILSTQALFRQGLVTISPGCEVLIDQLLRFPLGRYRDVADAFANAIEIARSPKMRVLRQNPDKDIPVSEAAKGLMKMFGGPKGQRMTTDPKKCLSH